MAIFFISDRYLKNLALGLEKNESYFLIKNLFSFSLAKNQYMAFSLPVSGQILMPIIFIIIITLIIVIFWLVFKHRAITLKPLILTFIVFGAISNILDRYQYGYVIDYFNLKNFSIFNLADIMISLGTIFLIYLYCVKNKISDEH